MARDTVVARIGKAHGLRGEVTVRLHTDHPEERFRPGAVFTWDGADAPAAPAGLDQLTVASARVHNGIWLLSFEGCADRSAAEALRGGRLRFAVEEDNTDGWYEAELVGLQVKDVSGEVIGEVMGLDMGAAQDRLDVRLTDGRRGLVPFVEALVPVVDVPAGHVVIDAPEGLFDLGLGR
ncbi:Ribosome maturation factor RimM [Austwickia sp. TVS 96-490-7B]|uniref:ribosome maturation factor RimM n=1 Tax=Austwickia sp. TVS 96-490-7B TaxID=2830843 RepID=UPI001C58B47B|nr:ribosome maturation factor RimM [Austwickia sp. TVS 96-490-7B]MBW3084518.1 Ribosome maturation factor RimM [Austwickia sp. TVS 96-490-7B]